jgi:hypothetical protein
MRRVRPKVHQLKSPPAIQLSVAEAQMIARRRAVVDMPTEQRDFAELWPRPRQPRKRRTA